MVAAGQPLPLGVSWWPAVAATARTGCHCRAHHRRRTWASSCRASSGSKFKEVGRGVRDWRVVARRSEQAIGRREFLDPGIRGRGSNNLRPSIAPLIIEPRDKECKSAQSKGSRTTSPNRSVRQPHPSSARRCNRQGQSLLSAESAARNITCRDVKHGTQESLRQTWRGTVSQHFFETEGDRHDAKFVN